MKIKKENFDKEVYEKIKQNAKKIIKIENYEFIFTDDDLFIKSSNLFSMKELNILFFIYEIQDVTKQEQEDYELQEKTYYTIGFTTLIDLKKYLYTESLQMYFLYFENEKDALTALTLLERSRYANWNYQKFIESK